MEKEDKWSYQTPVEVLSQTSHVSVGRDGTTVAIRKEGYKEAMAATLSYYNQKGERLHTAYLACAPQAGKETFESLLDLKIQDAKRQCPNAHFIGLADGAKDGWTYLNQHTQTQIIDFYHVTTYVSNFAKGYFKDTQQAKNWANLHINNLKNNAHAAVNLLTLMNKMTQSRKRLPDAELCKKSITYFTNNSAKMDYYQYAKQGFPIGSGVTEAACKVLVKQRLGASGMTWFREGVEQVLVLKQLVHTDSYWNQLWNKIDRYGF
jgi:hypothetical protein